MSFGLFASRFIAAGVERCVLIDGPGQGEALLERGLHLTGFESAIRRLIESLKKAYSCSEVNVFGVSFGGFLTMKLAQNVSEIGRAVCFSCTKNWNHLSDLPPRLTELFRLASGVKDDSSWTQFLGTELQIDESPPKCSVLIANGTHDAVMPIQASRELAEAHGPVELLELDDGHVFLHHVEDVVRQSAQWLQA